jgi:hypothetical protein
MCEGTSAERLKNINTRFASAAKAAAQAMGAFRDLMLEASKSSALPAKRAGSGSDRGASGLGTVFYFMYQARNLTARHALN